MRTIRRSRPLIAHAGLLVDIDRRAANSKLETWKNVLGDLLFHFCGIKHLQNGALETWLNASMSHWRPVVVSASFRSSAPLTDCPSSLHLRGRRAAELRSRRGRDSLKSCPNAFLMYFKVVLPSGKCEKISAMQENGSASADSWWSGRALCFTGNFSRPDRHVALDLLGALQRPL